VTEPGTKRPKHKERARKTSRPAARKTWPHHQRRAETTAPKQTCDRDNCTQQLAPRCDVTLKCGRSKNCFCTLIFFILRIPKKIGESIIALALVRPTKSKRLLRDPRRTWPSFYYAPCICQQSKQSRLRT
jgi:hypothetical protein